MTWINTIPFEHATGRLKKLYARVKGPDDNVDNIMMAHSLRPHTMEGHMAIYKNVLHHTGNSLPKWYLEAIGVHVSLLNKCQYCVEHHFEGMVSELGGNRSRAGSIRNALGSGDPFLTFGEREAQGLIYAGKLTLAATEIEKQDIEQLRKAGFDDGEILEINQVAAYFNYANRTVLGLGINSEGDTLGLAPRNNDDPDDWNHN
jgi:uncharacterized peroxidase-related enzyme